MLLSKLLNKKLRFEKANGDIISDLTRSTFKFPVGSAAGGGLTLVKQDEQMRPDLVANRVLGKQELWDSLLKFNGVSNPFALDINSALYILPGGILEKCIVSPKIIADRGETSELNPDAAVSTALVDPRTQKDQDRLLNLQKKIGEVLPPNINRQGVENAIERDGKIVFGDRNTAGSAGSSSSLSRERVKTALNQNQTGL
jgi:hypothetical protein